MLPKLHFPAQLPISAHIETITEALRGHQTIIVCGDTGSGKTTQLPKVALLAGRGKHAMIGCTQPRRLATLAMARRVAEEFDQPPGRLVGYQHRFDKKLSHETTIKFMTDGILLAETRHDRLLRAYDTLIIDEAHERSLNIDFLLGLLKQLLPRRRDLKLIISSATLDVERFSKFFHNAPVISVPGRLYPIETRWRPAGDDDDDPDLARQIATACDELMTEGAGDILVFLPGERDIRDAAETLKGRRLPCTEIIPLLASLPASEQQRAFTLTENRRIILATNVAETSVTLPGIRYVIDSGLARISRYATRTRIQRLHVEPISQASANQRMGRCGRIAPGVCIRLYSEDDFNKRDTYTSPEIQRSKLSGVILTMLDLKLGKIEEFPFIDPPTPAMIRQGYRELDLLGALERADTPPDKSPQEAAPRLSATGKQLARLPLDPTLAAMLLAAHREEALSDALTVVAVMECEDPRLRPIEKQAEADTCHARFLSPISDFAALLRLWRWCQEHLASTSQSTARRLCKQNFLSWPRIRDWMDLREQLTKLCQTLNFDTLSSQGGEVGLHRALLAGLLGNIGRRNPETNDYSGCHGLRFTLFPGSGLVKAKERKREERVIQRGATEARRHAPTQLLASKEWIMAGELVDTARLYARTVACLDPAWLEQLASAHCKYSHHSPAWDANRGFVYVKERVTLFGLLLVDGRIRDYSRIDPLDARAIFIREGLVLGAFPKPLPPFLHHNLQRISLLLAAEEKTRHHGALFDPEVAFRFYNERLPPDICNAAQLRRWLKIASSRADNRNSATTDPTALYMRESDLPPIQDLQHHYPDCIILEGNRLALSYRHAPDATDDGITCTVPAQLLPLTRAWHSEWLVPGMLPEKLHWMLTTLPAKTRRLLQPLGETITMCLTHLQPGKHSLVQALSNALVKTRGIRIPIDHWSEKELPDYLQMRFRVVDDEGREIGSGRNLELLIKLFAPRQPARDAPDKATSIWHKDNLTKWDFGTLPPQIDVGKAGWPILNYPALVDTGKSVSLRLFNNPEAALAAHAKGVARLIALALGKEWRGLTQPPPLSREATLCAQQAEISRETLGVEIGNALLHEIFIADKPAIRDAATFNERLTTERSRLHSMHGERTRLIAGVLHCASEVESLLLAKALPDTLIADMSEQLAWLIFPGFAEALSRTQLQNLPRYFEACRIRIQRALDNPSSDQRKLLELQPLWREYSNFVATAQQKQHNKLLLEQFRWQLEEFRVSLFAQELRTPVPVSAKRLTILWQRIFAE